VIANVGHLYQNDVHGAEWFRFVGPGGAFDGLETGEVGDPGEILFRKSLDFGEQKDFGG
jgi:hypothetical protein